MGLVDVSVNFGLSIQSLRMLTEKVGPVADQHDVAGIQQWLDGIGAALGIGVERTSAAPPTSTVEGKPSDSIQKMLTSLTALVKNPAVAVEIRTEILRHLLSPTLAPPSTGTILRRGALVTLVSLLDVVIAGLINAYYLQFRAALPADSAQISLAELRSLENVEAAELFIIEREVDSVLRGSLDQQLDYFKKRLKVDLAPLNPYFSRLVETVQRRHILVHNGGIVNKLYLAHVDPSLVDEYKLTIGGRAEIDDQYLRRAIDRVHLAGLVILQICWRKWFPEQVKQADLSLTEMHLFDTITAGRYVVAQNIGLFAQGIDLSTEKTRQYVALNLAQSYKWNGQIDEMGNVLNSRDWSSCGLEVKLALHALRDEYSEFFALLPKALASGQISKDNLERFPIFKVIRTLPQYSAFSTAAVDVN
jgi:hypothetical protein